MDLDQLARLAQTLLGDDRGDPTGDVVVLGADGLLHDMLSINWSEEGQCWVIVGDLP